MSPSSTHPISFKHGLPTGESPGWESQKWFLSELQWGNFWNTEMTLRDNRTGDFYTYAVDFEQVFLQLEAGYAINDQVSVAIGAPYALRFGGILDAPIDSYHRFVGADRFRRNHFPNNQERWSITKNGVEQLSRSSQEGMGPIFAKAKWWFYQPEGGHQKQNSGLAASVHVRSSGFSDLNEMSLMLHGGWNLFSKSSLWISAAFTKLASSDFLVDWPTRQWAQMYEAWFNFNLSERWNLVFQLKYESPFMEQGQLEFQYTSISRKSREAERAASGWNSLTAWRGSQSIGAVYLLKPDQRLTLLFMEDFARGDNDGRKNFLYVHGVPDIALVSQFQVLF